MVAEKIESAGLSLEERVVDIWRCAVVVKGGRRFSLAAMAVVGNGAGVLGVGYGKAREAPTAIEKAVKDAKKNLLRIPMYGTTLPHEVKGQYGSARVVLIPALPGTGLIAGAAVRAVLESIGVRDILTKSYGGSNNAKNLVKAVLAALLQLRGREVVAQLRGVTIPEDTLLSQSLRVQPPPSYRGGFTPSDRPRGRGRGRPSDSRVAPAVPAPAAVPDQAPAPAPAEGGTDAAPGPV